MYGVYLVIVKHKDHFTFAFSLFVSLFLLLNNENPRMNIIRGKTAGVISFISSPFTWIQSLMYLEKENQYLREKNLGLSLEIESMYNLHSENKELLAMLDFKKKKKLDTKSAKVVNKGIQPNLLSIIIMMDILILVL